MRPALFLALASLAFAASEPIVSLNSLRAVEASINDRVRSNINDPYDLLGPARGTYLEGYGAVFTVEMNLVVSSPLTVSPFSSAPSEAAIKALHDRKSHKLEGLKESMRTLMLSASRQLTGLPGDAKIVLEAFLFNYRWENSRGLAKRIVLTGEKQKLLDAAARNATPAQLASLIQDEEL